MTKKRNISAFIGLCFLVGLSGCAKRNKNKFKEKVCSKKSSCAANVDIPTADNAESISRFFDSELNDFVAVDNENDVKSAQAQNDQVEIQNIVQDLNVVQNSVDLSETSQDYNLDEQNATQQKNMKTIYFEFDQHGIAQDQIGALNINASKVQAALEQARQNGQEAVVVINGHACDSAGSLSYNNAKSLQRAQAIADYLVSNGVPRENIKVVGRGSEMPAQIEGKKVTGNREEQWPNRRSEIQII